MKKVLRVSNSITVALPREVLDALALQEGAEVVVTLDTAQRQIVIVPATSTSEVVDEALVHQVSDFIEQYRPALGGMASESTTPGRKPEAWP